jgi:hypothetical protein
VKTPNDPTTIAASLESIAGVDEPTTTVHTLSAWILAKDYERLKAERDELRAALQGLLYFTAGRASWPEVKAAEAALAKGADQ